MFKIAKKKRLSQRHCILKNTGSHLSEDLNFKIFWESVPTDPHLYSPPQEDICPNPLDPLSPNIHMQNLQTDLYTFPSRISWENFLKDHGSFSLEIILLILIILSLDNVWILLGENWCWSLLGLRGLKGNLSVTWDNCNYSNRKVCSQCTLIWF